MRRRFMLRLIIDPKTDRCYIDFAPMNECPGGDVAHRYQAVIPGDEVDASPTVSVDYDCDQRIAGVEILNPSSFLGSRFRADGDQAVFPVHLSVDYAVDEARIALRERNVDVTFDENSLLALIDVREVPVDAVRSVEAGPLTIHYNSNGRISAISMSCASIVLPRRFLRLGSQGK
jgi:uncharacterized protein YuzE